ncbi:hypothetical protein BJX70DRAFT_400499 [Aspergillus crustosus]
MFANKNLLALLPLPPLLALTLPHRASAKCILKNVIESSEKTSEKESALCEKQDPGYWTFSMQNSMVGVPTFDGDNAFAGVTGSSAFAIYNEDCLRLGVFGPSNEDNDCGTPYVINENSWLPYELQITGVNFGLGSGDFTFKYANGAYMIGENGAKCKDISEGCQTSFPVEGEDE